MADKITNKNLKILKYVRILKKHVFKLCDELIINKTIKDNNYL